MVPPMLPKKEKTAVQGPSAAGWGRGTKNRSGPSPKAASAPRSADASGVLSPAANQAHGIMIGERGGLGGLPWLENGSQAHQ